MSYKHKWINDWARWVAIDESGVMFEFKERPVLELGIWNDDGSRRSSQIHGIPHYAAYRDSLIQRFTDRQMGLEAQGWTIGDWDTWPIDGGSLVCVKYEGNDKNYEGCAYDWAWHGIIAYRLLDEVLVTKLSVNDKPKSPVLDFAEKILHGEPKHRKWLMDAAINYDKGLPMPSVDSSVKSTKWKAGELPSVGDRFEILDPKHQRWNKGLVTAHGEKIILVIMDKQENDNESILNKTCSFRPLQTEKERVIAKAESIADHYGAYSDHSKAQLIRLLEKFHELGMLSMPKGEENNIEDVKCKGCSEYGTPNYDEDYYYCGKSDRCIP